MSLQRLMRTKVMQVTAGAKEQAKVEAVRALFVSSFIIECAPLFMGCNDAICETSPFGRM